MVQDVAGAEVAPCAVAGIVGTLLVTPDVVCAAQVYVKGVRTIVTADACCAVAGGSAVVTSNAAAGHIEVATAAEEDGAAGPNIIVVDKVGSITGDGTAGHIEVTREVDGSTLILNAVAGDGAALEAEGGATGGSDAACTGIAPAAGEGTVSAAVADGE